METRDWVRVAQLSGCVQESQCCHVVLLPKLDLIVREGKVCVCVRERERDNGTTSRTHVQIARFFYSVLSHTVMFYVCIRL